MCLQVTEFLQTLGQIHKRIVLLVTFVRHLSLQSTWKHWKWDSNNLLVSVTKCYECLQCWQGVCSLTWKSCRWQIDFWSCCGGKGRALTAASQMEANPGCMACCNAVMPLILPFTAFSFIVKAVIFFAVPWKIPFYLPRCVCVSVSQRSRYSIRTEQWQEPQRTIKNSKSAHTLTNMHSTHTHTHTEWEGSAFLTQWTVIWVKGRGGRRVAIIKTEEGCWVKRKTA